MNYDKDGWSGYGVGFCGFVPPGRAGALLADVGIVERHSESGEREESIRCVLDSLVGQRQALRRAGADEVSLAANGLAMAYWQQQLHRRPAPRGPRRPKPSVSHPRTLPWWPKSTS